MAVDSVILKYWETISCTTWKFITAKLIDECGLKGFSVGGASVSEKHAGFIINKDNATAKDILDLIEIVKTKVYEKTGEKNDK